MRTFQEKEGENIGMNLENVQLRERLEICEGLLSNNNLKLEQQISSQMKSTMEASNAQYGRMRSNSLLGHTGHKTAEGFR
jgi:hypothetical protein